MLFTLLVVSFLLYMVLRLTGTDPLNVILGEKQKVSDEAREAIRVQYHLNDPLIVQYGIWLRDALQGDLGIDYVQKVPVNSLIAGRLAITVGMVVLSMLISVIIAIPLGIISALRKNSSVDYVISFIMLILTSMPGFLVAMLALVFLNKYVPGYKSIGTYENVRELFERITAPSVCLAFGNIALIGRLTRNTMVEQLNSDYVMTLKAKGIASRRIIMRHTFKNSIIPVFTVTAMLVGTMIGSSVLVEQIFSLPGLGSLLSTAVLKHNYPVIMALTLIILVIFQVVTLISDVLYTIIDPRIKL